MLMLYHRKQEIIYTHYWGWYTPIDVNTHTQTVLPIWGVCTVLVHGVFVHSVGF